MFILLFWILHYVVYVKITTVELQWLEHLWNHENMFETWVVRASEGKSWRQVRKQKRDIFSIFFSMKVYCVFSLESPHEGDPNGCIQYTIFNIKKKITLNCPKSAAMWFFPGTEERVRNSRGKRAIRVRATEVLLYVDQLKLLDDLTTDQLYCFNNTLPCKKKISKLQRKQWRNFSAL